MQLSTFEDALQAPTMDAVIALTERFQTLEANPEGRVFTAWRSIDQLLMVGYTETMQCLEQDYVHRGFTVIDQRRGTRREHRLLLATLKEIGLNGTCCESCFTAKRQTIMHLDQLGWPIGALRTALGQRNSLKQFRRRN